MPNRKYVDFHPEQSKTLRHPDYDYCHRFNRNILKSSISCFYWRTCVMVKLKHFKAKNVKTLRFNIVWLCDRNKKERRKKKQEGKPLLFSSRGHGGASAIMQQRWGELLQSKFLFVRGDNLQLGNRPFYVPPSPVIGCHWSCVRGETSSWLFSWFPRRFFSHCILSLWRSNRCATVGFLLKKKKKKKNRNRIRLITRTIGARFFGGHRDARSAGWQEERFNFSTDLTSSCKQQQQQQRQKQKQMQISSQLYPPQKNVPQK